ncbi:Gas vesicle protein [Micromonospora viridifaciens]|uniref:Gas vesicle protein A n=1 Tax=Micromonospora viridifaciens TaxID=1881 RepID=A0A1C4UT42_MICVI|nr:gas vesicle protein GvpJ [Micromonospora viridifaciens]SCE74782.1 Gas vesicle protein [Micromonospora viridifaciens]
MTITTTTGQPDSALERTGGGGGTLADVVETVLDKGVVIDAQVSVAVIGIQLLEINARVVIASVETYLRFAEAVDRLSIVPKQQKGLPDLVEGASGAVTKGRAVSGLGKAAGAIGGAVRDAFSGLDSDASDADAEDDRSRDRGRDRERSHRRERER